MKLNNKIGICIFLLVFSILLIQNTFALGIAPARKIVDYQPGLQETVQVRILNNEHKDMDVVLYAEGDFASIITLSQAELEFTASEEEKTISYTYRLPDSALEPGPHEVDIIAREIPVKAAVQGTSIGVSIAVVTQLIINVPYPGKYATAELKIAETGLADQVNFIVVVNNFGTQKIVEAKGSIDIFGPTNEKIATIVSESGPVNPGERGEFNVVWTGNINPGKYYAKLSVSYDGDIAEADRVFDVGTPLIEIKDISVKDFRLGEIAKFEIFVENIWSDTMKDVYSELIISENGAEIGRFKSASENVNALSKQTLIAYWDTAGVDEGVYDAHVILYYNGKSTSQDMKAHISLTSIYFDAFGTGLVTSPGVGGGPNWLVIGLAILVVINIGWFIYFKFRKKK